MSAVFLGVKLGPMPKGKRFPSRGTVTHLIPSGGAWNRAALCGARPGGRSAGWGGAYNQTLTCAGCVAAARRDRVQLVGPMQFTTGLASMLEAMSKEENMAKQTTQVETKPQSVAARLGLERLPKMTKSACAERAKSLTARIEAGEFDSDPELLSKAKTWASYYRRQSQVAKNPKPAKAAAPVHDTSVAEDVANTVIEQQQKAATPAPKPSKKSKPKLVVAETEEQKS